MKGKKYRKKLPALICAALLIMPDNVTAATQGSTGNTSTGTANISITKAVQARITDISDMTLANWNPGDGAVTLYSDVCIYSSTGSYKVTASGSGLLGIFTINSGLNLIAYSVSWNDGGVGNLSNSGSSLLAGLPSAAFSNANSSSTDCSGGGGNDNARVIVEVSALAMGLAASSSTPYTGTLTMVVSPN